MSCKWKGAEPFGMVTVSVAVKTYRSAVGCFYNAGILIAVYQAVFIGKFLFSDGN